ncbi:MAG: hypothetical protein IKS40_06005 [Treponema sp.]|nr:hypothetical protein [Treponema sp.]
MKKMLKRILPLSLFVLTAAFCCAAALDITGMKYLGTHCKAGRFDLPEGSTESLVFAEMGDGVKLVGTGHGFSSSGTYVIDESKKTVTMTFNENGSGVLVGKYDDDDCASLAVEGKVRKGIIKVTLTGIFVRQTL